MKARGDDSVQLKADPIAVQIDIERCGQGGEPQVDTRSFSPEVHIKGNLGDQGNPRADIESAEANGEIEQSKAEISAVIEGSRSDAGGIGILPLLGRGRVSNTNPVRLIRELIILHSIEDKLETWALGLSFPSYSTTPTSFSTASSTPSFWASMTISASGLS
jgi:hypothetical protein